MIDRRLVGALLVIGGFAVGWFVRVRVASPPPGEARSTVGAVEHGSGATTASRTATFEGIYRDATWGVHDGSAGTSGFGSMVNTTVIYRSFLETFMKDHQIHSVVDAGCGDWEFSQAIDWTGIDYKGYDIVGSVIEHDKQLFAKPSIQFFAGDIVDADLPPADLLISKDVLQHLPNADVQKFLAKQLPKYKYVLLTNGTEKRSLTSSNYDIDVGHYRPVDLTQPPFSVDGLKILTYFDGRFMHQVLFISRP